MIGQRYRHLKRGSTYLVIGKHTSALTDHVDGGTGYFMFSTAVDHDMRTVAQMVPGERDSFYADTCLKLPLTFQISSYDDPKWGGRRDWVRWIVYQCEQDGRVWARPEDEFSEDRFERIKP